MAKAKKRMGRPPRAEGEKMERLSVVVRHRFREAVELVSMHRRTSASQALEHLISLAAKEYEIEGVPLLTLADRLTEFPDNYVGAIERLRAIPPSLLAPDQLFLLDVASQIPDISALTIDEAMFLIAVSFDSEVSGNTKEFALLLWRKVCEALLDGEEIYEWVDANGMKFRYELSLPKDSPRLLPPAKTIARTR